MRLDGNDYSVDPAVIGRRVRVVADLDSVRVFAGDRQVAHHPRCWARHQTITDPAHAEAAIRMRTTVARPSTWQTAPGEVEVRSLADYDAAFGLTASDEPEAVA